MDRVATDIGMWSSGIGAVLALLTIWGIMKWEEPKSANFAGLKFTLWMLPLGFFFVGQASIGWLILQSISVELRPARISLSPGGVLIGFLVLYLLFFLPLFLIGRWRYTREERKRAPWKTKVKEVPQTGHDQFVEAVESLASQPGVEASYLTVVVGSVRELVQDKDKLKALQAALSEQRRTVAQWATTFTINSIADQLESGRHHVARGVLGSYGQGALATLETLVARNVELGTYTREFADERVLAVVKRNITSVG